MQPRYPIIQWLFQALDTKEELSAEKLSAIKAAIDAIPELEKAAQAERALYEKLKAAHAEITCSLPSVININMRDDSPYKATLLMRAVKGGHTKIVTHLIEAKADANIQDSSGDTALVWAAYLGHQGITQILLTANVKTNIANKTDNKTALVLAAEKGHDEVVLALINANANIEHESRDGTALDVAIRNKNKKLSTVHLLLSKGAIIKNPENLSHFIYYFMSNRAQHQIVQECATYLAKHYLASLANKTAAQQQPILNAINALQANFSKPLPQHSIIDNMRLAIKSQQTKDESGQRGIMLSTRLLVVLAGRSDADLGIIQYIVPSDEKLNIVQIKEQTKQYLEKQLRPPTAGGKLSDKQLKNQKLASFAINLLESLPEGQRIDMALADAFILAAADIADGKDKTDKSIRQRYIRARAQASEQVTKLGHKPTEKYLTMVKESEAFYKEQVNTLINAEPFNEQFTRRCDGERQAEKTPPSALRSFHLLSHSAAESPSINDSNPITRRQAK